MYIRLFDSGDYICIMFVVCDFICSGYIQAEAAGGWALQGSKGDYIILAVRYMNIYL